MRTPQRVDDAAHRKTRCVGINDKAGNAIAAFVIRSARKHEPILGFVRPTDPQLAAIDNPVVTVLYGLGLNCASRV